jgi:wyosine [tRNA(Phe)-imidazoG37] synthetase (radical SAM superfamily)
MQPSAYRYLFGPVPSRRFGRSLGIDLTPLKTCSLDCVFCQLGRTAHPTLERRAYVPTAEVITEIEHWLQSGATADYLTLSGSGEPTLHAEFGRVLEAMSGQSIPTVLLTNGSLLHHPRVREAAARADVVKVSLSAWDQQSYEWVNRPHPQLRFETVVEGIRQFRRGYGGQLWLEVFLLTGINAHPAQVEKIARLSRELAPDRVHLNTVVRPPAEDFAAAVAEAELEALAGRFDPPAEIALSSRAAMPTKSQADATNILAMLKRRPCTIHQIQAAYGLHINEASKILGLLMRDRHVKADMRNHEVYYTTV